MKILFLCLLLVLAGCGNSKSSSGNPPPPPPPPGMPMTGTFSGGMNFTVVTGDLKLVLSEDGSGVVTGSAISTPPSCEFNSQVSGRYFTSGQQFQVVSGDGAESFTGTLSSDQKSLSGTVQLGAGNLTGCGPRNGSFSATKQ